MTIQELKQKNLLLFECISGSKAYGLDTATSDTDIRGVYYLPKEQFYGLEYTPQVSDETNDEVYYELGRFIELLIRNNPNILELLATPEDCVLYCHPLMDRLLPELFLSKLCKETFAGYALTQVRKARGLNKKIVTPVAPERKSVPDFCYVMRDNISVPLNDWLAENGYQQERCGLSSIAHTKGLYALYYDDKNEHGYSGIISGPAANEVSLSSIPREAQQRGYLYFNVEAYSAYCKEYREYREWEEKRNPARYTANMQHGKNYDAKNMMHTIRLLQMAGEILREGRLLVRRPNREQLLNIKSGKYEYDELMLMADELMNEIENAYSASVLPAAPDKAMLEKVLVQMRNELYN
ncbi:nucleotidyltransferase domain-containing protein [Chitinophagaceae bacterium MMS25-I14]